MRRRAVVALLAVGLVAAVLLIALFGARRAAPPPDPLAFQVAHTPIATAEPPRTETALATATILEPTLTRVGQTATAVSAAKATAKPPATIPPRTATTGRRWEWPEPGFAGWTAITVTEGIEHYVYYNWSAGCDAPARRQVPMIWGKTAFYTDTIGLKALFNGPCNDGRPLLFLNEPAKEEQAKISPAEAANMFYTMTRSTTWPYARWQGPIYAGGNLVEDREWDQEFVRQFATLHNAGSTIIPEIAGWSVHLYGNYEYGPKLGDPNVAWTGDIPPEETRAVVDRSINGLDEYVAERKAEGNSALLLVTEFGLLQAPSWHEPPAYYYETTARFMEEYVRRFDGRPEIQAWFSFISTSPKDEFLDTNFMIDSRGALTPNGVKWRELAKARQ